MTGQVKEEIITRFGELGLNISGGVITINPKLLKPSEFLTQSDSFKFENVFGDSVVKVVEKGCLAFTYCQVPFIYQITDSSEMEMSIVMNDGSEKFVQGSTMPLSLCEHIFSRSGKVEKVRVFVPKKSCWG